ncbi:MAG TPA: hypothetical protein VGP68_22720 [Gemmataceae bacterium]|nr:hypothetical protein [Gemmataceae bacterium]
MTARLISSSALYTGDDVDIYQGISWNPAGRDGGAGWGLIAEGYTLHFNAAVATR